MMPNPTRSTATVDQMVPKPAGSGARSRRRPAEVLDRTDVCRLETLGTLLHLELDLLTLVKAAVAG